MELQKEKTSRARPLSITHTFAIYFSPQFGGAGASSTTKTKKPVAKKAAASTPAFTNPFAKTASPPSPSRAKATKAAKANGFSNPFANLGGPPPPPPPPPKPPPAPPLFGNFKLPDVSQAVAKISLPDLPTGGGSPAPSAPPSFEPPNIFGDAAPPSPPPPAPMVAGVDPSSELLGAGVAGAAVGGVLADVLTAGAGTALTGELLTDAAAIGAVALGGAAAYAATRPDEAGEAARFVGGAVANTTTAYAELAAVNAELALLEQQQAVQAKIDRTVQDAQNKIDQTVYDIQATPGRLQDKAAQTAVDTAAAVKAAPRKTADAITNKIKSTLESVQGSAQAQLDAARREIDQRKN